MSERLTKWLLECVGLWVLLVIIGLIFGDGSFGAIVLVALIASPVLRIMLMLERERSNSGIAPRETKSGMISCRKCGYIGAGHGHCPRCGWTVTEKLTSHTMMISCRNCGYIGAGSGHCPKCGWTRVTKLQ